MFLQLQNLFKLLKDTKAHSGCDQCVHSGPSGCSYDFPEYNTPEAVDCMFYETAS